jgi:hypothetical protein
MMTVSKAALRSGMLNEWEDSEVECACGWLCFRWAIEAVLPPHMHMPVHNPKPYRENMLSYVIGYQHHFDT